MNRKGPRRTRAGLALVAALVALTGCTGGGEDTAPPPATGTLEQLARRAGCTPDIQTDAAEIRQADCGSGSGRYVLLTFATDRGRAEWLDAADDYGGTYLLGRRWIAVGPEASVTRLRERLGGTVERAAGHHAGH
jgi:hypothetical protein